MKILLLEDEIMLCHSITDYLEKTGHLVRYCYDGKEALDIVAKEEFDLLILDINVPALSGFELLENLQKSKILTPVIFISALTDIEDITKAFELGCKDYIKKPFHLKELGLRIDRISKLIEEKKHIILSKNYRYSKEKKTLYFNDTPVELTKRQLQIIDLLAKNAGLVVDFDMFKEYVWNEEEIDNASIRAEISRLKKILKENIIHNIRGLGYKIEKISAY
ncbi:response regulator transcription factor [Nitrosophilus alvini]|uniref:response regulator transcription factor n=1 Tax=Nitrosophilus alvini TaxID=2714855 RepID=UPI00190B14C6|nr:response regulator transcription factor [Nitrosophilus alvini]